MKQLLTGINGHMLATSGKIYSSVLCSARICCDYSFFISGVATKSNTINIERSARRIPISEKAIPASFITGLFTGKQQQRGNKDKVFHNAI